MEIPTIACGLKKIITPYGHCVYGCFVYLSTSSDQLEGSWGRSYGSAKIGFQDKLCKKAWKWLSVGKLSQATLRKCLFSLMVEW